jgi:hypothetical protein
MNFEHVNEADLVTIVSTLRPLIAAFEHQSCGVDSYSVEDFARESMSIVGTQTSDAFTLGASDDDLKACILVVETLRWAQDLAQRPVDQVVRDIEVAYLAS